MAPSEQLRLLHREPRGPSAVVANAPVLAGAAGLAGRPAGLRGRPRHPQRRTLAGDGGCLVPTPRAPGLMRRSVVL